jgi:peptidoglycan/LPS O-acetylase OafA/YrhL
MFSIGFPAFMLNQFNLKSGLRNESSYLYELESLRGIAILLVFFFHTHGMVFGSSPQQPSLLMSFVVSGNTGVTLFFVLSGFLLSLPWLNYLLGKRSAPPNMINFYRARALRILPLYWVAVVASVALTGKIASGAKAAGFLFVGFDIFPYSVVWWTLATEVQFYILLPLGFWAWTHSGLGRGVLLAIFATWLYFYTTLIILQQLPLDQLSYFYNKSIFGRLPAFLFGIVAGWIYLKLKDSARHFGDQTGTRLASTALCAIIICCLGFLLQASAVLSDSFAEKHWHIRHTYESALWAAIILCFVLTRPIGRGLLINRPLAITGKLSYSLYLIHVPVIFYLIYPAKQAMGVEQYMNSPWLYINPILALALSLGLSAVTYRLIELPFLNLKHRIPTAQDKTR